MISKHQRVPDMKIFALLLVFCFVWCHSSLAKISKKDFQHAINLFGQNQYDEAIAVLKTALDEDPDQAPIYNLIGMIYLKQNESIQSAVGSFEQAIRIDPNFAEAYFNLASTYAGPANRPDLAAEYFKKTLEIDPRYVKAYFGLGWFTLTTMEKPEKAAEYFQKAIDSFPDFAEAYYGLGLSYIQMGKAPMALQSVSRLRTLGREDLASYLETILRGGKVSNAMRDEAQNSTAPENTLQTSPGAPGAAIPGLSPVEGNGSLSGTAGQGLSVDENSSGNSNPFQLN